MSPDRLRAYVLIVTRDIVPCLGGIFLLVYLPVTGTFETWHGGLIAALFGIPLAAPRGKDDES